MSVVAGRFVLSALFAFAAPISAKVADAEPVGLLPEIVAEHGEIVIGGTFECHIEYLAKGSKTICDPTNIPPPLAVLLPLCKGGDHANCRIE
jgi:hypothetical protein